MTLARVLIVDDEHNFIVPLSKRLRRRGYRVHAVSSGIEALRVMEAETIDVTVLDVSMPDIDGIKTLVEIKKRHPQVEVLMLTAHAESDLVISSLSMGAFDYLIKPVELEELTGKIEEAARRGGGNSAEDRD